MAKHQIFLVHGMGNFEKNWSLGIQQQLRDIFSAYGNTKEMVNDFDLIEITYDPIFEEWRQQWKQDANAAAAAAIKLGLNGSVANQLISLASSPTGNSFFQTYVLDVVMYRYLKQFSETVNQSVREQILRRLKSFSQDDIPHWSVIAHSLGTSVIHNTLHSMFTQTVDATPLSDYFRPWYIFMIANVSKVLWQYGGDIYASEVYPHDADTSGMCYKYGNFHHECDFFTLVDPFNPPPTRFPPHLYIDVKLDAADIRDWNIHGLSHYISHPSVHVPLIRALRPHNPNIISTTEYNEALDKWRATRLSGVALSIAQQKLQGFAAGTLSDWKNVINNLVDYRQAVIADLQQGIGKQDGETY